ncbi:hypothetical protein BN2476_1020010 [Paraburkholderia piptadeniae]|uniref:Uncharacterized protein n=1 Tax=Paraburkholderia piptadeniae TaxID=1701573 RepID=A0A1N7SUZ2_9BURK|nr:hypothetical protein BN2476_1020010 [Paraburkholderia piptadeniae]
MRMMSDNASRIIRIIRINPREPRC